jgi:tRNA nucleotidyltransferase (CCA-adding enzyme)
MRIYLVGGAVRDGLLELPVRERDWVIVGATEAEVEAAGFERLKAGFPVFLHPETREEYALARRERKTGPGYKGFVFDTGPDVTLEEDLARRDFTINAMAQDEAGAIVDPFGGRDDLDAGLIRHVTPAFAEDPVRVLRGARFAAVLGRWGFRLAHGTHALMKRMAAGEDMAHVEPPRLWREMRRALEADQPWRFFEVLAGCGALECLLPGLASHLDAPAGHGLDTQHGALADLRSVAATTDALDLRFAAVLTGPVLSGMDADALRTVLPADGACYDRLDRCVAIARALPELAGANGPEVVDFLNAQRAFSQPQRLRDDLALCAAVLRDDGGEDMAARLLAALEAARGVDVGELTAQGLRGPALRHVLDQRRAAAVDAVAATGG